MAWHPLTLAVWLTEGAAWGVYLASLWRILAIVPRWAPDRHDAPQLRRERLLDLVAYQGHWTLILQGLVLVLVVAGISNGWVPVVPGAMCGTGVLQAMGPAGRQALVLKAAALLMLYCWRVVERLSRAGDGPIPAVVHSRVLLLAAPVMAVATLRLVQAVAAVTPHAPVSCCVALYERIVPAGAGRDGVAGGPLFHESTWLMLATAATVSLAVWGWVTRRRRAFPCRAALFVLPPWLLLWHIAVYKALTLGVAPYIYQILYHPCPWCLFRADHGAVGAVLFGLPLWMTAEGAAGLSAWMVARRYPQSSIPALHRWQRAGARIGRGALVLLLFAAWPILSWRIRSGGWIN